VTSPFKACVMSATLSYDPPISATGGGVKCAVTGSGTLTNCVSRSGVGVVSATFTLSGSGDSLTCFTGTKLTLQLSYADGTSSTVSLTPVIGWTQYRGTVTSGTDKGRQVLVVAEPDPAFTAACATGSGASRLNWTGTFNEL
jgi:hypothetical protein